MDKIPFEDGKLVEAPYVEINGVKHEVKPAKYTGPVPMSALNLNKMQDNIEKEINNKSGNASTVDNLVIKGNSKQEVREGKNHFNINGTITNGSPSQIANNGVILTKNDSNRVFGVRFDALPAGTYMLSCNITNNTTKKNASIAIRTDTVNEKFFSIPVGTVGKYTQELVLTSGTTNAAYIFISAEDTDGVSIAIQDIQIEKGTVATSFEQYGASPSVEFESPVESCGDDINIFDKDKVQIGKAWNLANNTARAIFIEKVNPNTYYTISFENINNLEGLYYFERANEADTTPTVSSTPINNTVTKKVLATSNYLGIQFNKKDISINDIEKVKLKIQKGKVATPYSPYGQGSITIVNSNKNLTSTNKISTVGGGKLNNTTGLAEPVKAGKTYTISFKNNSNSTNNLTLRLLEKPIGSSGQSVLEALIARNLVANTRNSLTFTPNYDGYIGFSATVSSSDIADVFTEIQLEEGETATDCIEHKSLTHIIPTQKPFRAVGDTRDSFVKIDGQWYEKHNIGRVIFDGTETWQYNETYKYFLCPTFIFKYIPSTTNKTQISNMFEVTSNWEAGFRNNVTTELIFSISNDGYKVCIRNLNYTKPEDFANWLATLNNAGTPLYVDYVLKTPELIPCTSEQAKALNGIYEAYADGQTNMYSTDSIEPIIEVVKESKEQVQSETNKAISALLERVSQLEARLTSTQAEEGV